jgi:hypothetical protein
MTSPPPTLAQIAPWLALALFGFAIFWCLVTFLLSRMSGWATIAAAYPAGEVLSPSSRWAWQSAFMNLNTKYNASLTVVADPQAVHFSVFAPFAVGHRPFSVPWPDIHAEMRQLLLMQRVALTFTRAPGVTMLIPPKLAERLAAASLGRFAMPAPLES